MAVDSMDQSKPKSADQKVLSESSFLSLFSIFTNSVLENFNV